MARSRNIKPGFFENDALAENSPLGRLFFIGLWCHADSKGRLEWRPKKLKHLILPYDDCDITEIAINLDRSGFISIYSGQNRIYLQIVNFEKHQNPHKNERDKGSDLPEYSESMRQAVDFSTLTINPDSIGNLPEEYPSDPEERGFPPTDIPNPDSGLRNEDAGLPPDDKPPPADTREKIVLTKDWIPTIRPEARGLLEARGLTAEIEEQERLSFITAHVSREHKERQTQMQWSDRFGKSLRKALPNRPTRKANGTRQPWQLSDPEIEAECKRLKITTRGKTRKQLDNLIAEKREAA